MRGIGLSKKLMIGGGYVISDIGLKCQNLNLNPKKLHAFCLMFPDFIYVIVIVNKLLTTKYI